MINIEIYKDERGILKGFRTSGHSEYAEEGHDIICSAVSALEITIANGIITYTEDGKNTDISMMEDEGIFELYFRSAPSREAEILLNTLISGFESMEREYPSNVKLDYKEVRSC